MTTQTETQPHLKPPSPQDPALKPTYSQALKAPTRPRDPGKPSRDPLPSSSFLSSASGFEHVIRRSFKALFQISTAREARETRNGRNYRRRGSVTCSNLPPVLRAHLYNSPD